MRAQIASLSRNMEGEYLLTLRTRDRAVVDVYNDLHDGDVTAEVKRFHPKRSRDANAYAWVLIDKLAAALQMAKTDVYREAIRDIGGVSDTCCVTDRAVDSLINGWRHNGIGWFAETMPSKLKGCTNVILYRGSSTYDSKQMAALIDVLVRECKEQHIETMTPQEIAAMNAAWGDRYGRTKADKRPRADRPAEHKAQTGPR